MERGSSAVGKLSSRAAIRSRDETRKQELHLPERGLALALLVASSPLLLFAALIVRRAGPGPILYRGTRLGLKKRPFIMYKFRTLKEGANQVTGGELFNHTHVDLTIPRGKFLRETRLDELPQLWNVVRGDMSFVGPRPERPEVYEKQCREIDGYEKRFEVRPGLIGFSQLFTPHGTAKRYRTLIDNARIRQGLSAPSTLIIVAYTAAVVLRKSFLRGCQYLQRDLVRRKLLNRYHEKRRLRRVRPEGARAFLSPVGPAGAEPHPLPARLLDMNEHALLVACEDGMGEAQRADVRLEIPLGDGRVRRALCQGYVTHRRTYGGQCALVLQYRPHTARSDYVIHQYFLRTSLAEPRRRHGRRGAPPARRDIG
jgi:lipopolysaccharide/colanic/teichoic acid biosynthesis glycosyltransferase